MGVAKTQRMIFNGVPDGIDSARWPTRVDILANATAATFLVVTDDDDVDETDSVITATVNAGNGYTAGTSGSASVTVEDNDGTTQQQQAGTPGAPRDFSARPAGESRIDLSWTAPAGEPTGYEIEWSADGETGWTAVDPAHAGTATEYADEGLDGGDDPLLPGARVSTKRARESGPRWPTPRRTCTWCWRVRAPRRTSPRRRRAPRGSTCPGRRRKAR